MSIYFYLIIWGLGGCLVGICIGFFFAALLAGGGSNDKEIIRQQAESIDALVRKNEELVIRNIDLIDKLDAVKAVFTKHFGDL